MHVDDFIAMVMLFKFVILIKVFENVIKLLVNPQVKVYRRDKYGFISIHFGYPQNVSNDRIRFSKTSIFIQNDKNV